MSLLKWFSTKPTQSAAAPEKLAPGRDTPSRTAAQPGSSCDVGQRPSADNRSEQRKVKRHARREQLYIAVRDAMTHSGVLSSSYKFKVLSLDQRGDQFLVMMDVDQSVDNQASNLTGIEARIVQAANARFAILVSSVYWRFSDEGVPLRARSPSLGQTPAIAPKAAPPVPVVRKPPSHHDPIQDDEVAAFKRALASAAASGGSLTDTTGKTRTGQHSYTLLTGFEDTELPDSYTAPVLSTTQYGELN
jgi:hypothetical protein